MTRGNSFYVQTNTNGSTYTGLSQSGVLLGKNFSDQGFLENRLGTKLNVEKIFFPKGHHLVDVFTTGYGKQLQDGGVLNKWLNDQSHVYLMKNISKNKEEAYVCAALFGGFNSSYVEGNMPTYQGNRQIMYGKVANKNQTAYGFYALYNQSDLCQDSVVEGYRVELADSTVLQVIPTKNITWAVIKDDHATYLQAGNFLMKNVKLGKNWSYRDGTSLEDNKLVALLDYQWDNTTTTQYIFECEHRYLGSNVTTIAVSRISLPSTGSYTSIGNDGAYFYLFGNNGKRPYVTLLDEQFNLLHSYYPYTAPNGTLLFSTVLQGGGFFFMTNEMGTNTLVYSKKFLDTKSQCVRFSKKNITFSLPNNYSYPSFNISSVTFSKLNVSYHMVSSLNLTRLSYKTKGRDRCQGDRYKKNEDDAYDYTKRNNHVTRTIWSAYAFALAAVFVGIFFALYKYFEKRELDQKNAIERVRKEINVSKVQSSSTGGNDQEQSLEMMG